MNEQTDRKTLRAVARSLCLRVGIVAVLAFGAVGCSIIYPSRSLPDVELQGEFTHDELITAIGEIFDDPSITEGLELNESANVRTYSSYRPQDYIAVNNWIRPILPRWNEGFLCVQFAQAMRLGFSFAASKDEWHLERRNPPAIAWFGVFQFKAFGGVPAGGRHALNIYIAGPRGGMSCWVMEPQSGHTVRVAWQEDGGWAFDETAYPNWRLIEFVRLEL